MVILLRSVFLCPLQCLARGRPLSDVSERTHPSLPNSLTDPGLLMDAKTVVFYWAPGLPVRESSGGAVAVALGRELLGQAS